jgi:tetratricopeptide (TPR) repeat protein
VEPGESATRSRGIAVFRPRVRAEQEKGKGITAPRVDGRGAAAALRSSTAVAEAPGVPPLTAEQWFHLGCELEGTSPLEARQAYVHAIEGDPELADAHLNLGRLYHEAGELGKAEAHYRTAARCAPEDAICHFNLGVLLEDRGHPDDAVFAYRQAIARDAEAADAHHNLGLLLEARGRAADAMKHLMIARRLYAQQGGED